MRSSIAERRATMSTRIASTLPLRALGRPAAAPDITLHSGMEHHGSAAFRMTRFLCSAL
jgi:hypothetical protein